MEPASDSSDNTSEDGEQYFDNEFSSTLIDNSSEEESIDAETQSSDLLCNELPAHSTEVKQTEKHDSSFWKSGMTLNDLMKLRDKMGIKKFNKTFVRDTKTKQTLKNRPHKNRTSKRKNKSRPLEISSKLKVPFLRKVISSSKSKHVPRDPRFDDLCGSQFNEETFNKTYAFLDDIKQREINELKETLKKSEDPYQRKRISYLLRRMKNQQQAKEHRDLVREVEKEWWKEELEKVEKGIKKPFHLTKKKRKELLEQKKLKQFKQSSKLEKSQANKEKRLKSKEYKRMPKRRTVDVS